MSFITSIGVAVPPHRFKQETIAAFMEKAMHLDYESTRKLKTIFRASGIKTRHSILDDYGKSSGYSFYTDTQTLDPFPTTEIRLQHFQKHAQPLAREAIYNCLNKRNISRNKITHLILVSCTGMYAPGLDIDLVKTLGLPESVQRTCITFMGCYAAFNAIKIANSIVKADPDATVLIACVELCTLHFQREGTDDNLLANALFSDGAAAVLVEGNKQPGWNLSAEVFHNALAYNGREHMTWTIGNLGFEMKLSTYVPDVIRTGIKNLTTSLLSRVNKKIEEIDFFAIHPGGKKILEVIEDELGISHDKNKPAYDVLGEYGNMSSPTVLFVLHNIVTQLTREDDGKHILSFAFGPGLTLEGTLYQIQFT